MDTNGLSRLVRAAALLVALALSVASAHADADPPGRVARLNYTSGTVTFAPSGSDEWARVNINRPLVTGDSVWVERGALSEMHVGSTVVRLGGETSASLLRLDDDVAQFSLTQGSLNLHVRSLASGQIYEVDTPNLAFSVQSPGTYRIDVTPDGGMTTVTVRQGSAIAYGAASNTTMSAGQQVSFTGTDLQLAGSAGNPPFDDFDRWANDRDRIEDTAVSASYVSRDVIGYEELDGWGTWQRTPQYGMVWVPRVTVADWAPYRTGHWTWISPWGWTWVDDAPWGFAPYHYGRWAYFGGRWCWVPGRIVSVRPVYAPALVAFVGGSGFSFSLTIGGGTAPGVGWFPLGPGEVYRPAYAVSQTYIQSVNKTVVVNNTTINNITVNKVVYVNKNVPNAVTAVPVSVFTRGEPVGHAVHNVSPQTLRNIAAVSAAPQVAPPKHGFVGLTPHEPPVAARNAFERTVVATTPAPGHRTVRAELAGSEMPTVDRGERNKSRPGTAQQAPAGQPVPGPSRAVEREAAPSRNEQRAERDRNRQEQNAREQNQREFNQREANPRESNQREAVPRPPRRAEERPAISHVEPSRPVQPSEERRATRQDAPAPARERSEPQVERRHPERLQASEPRPEQVRQEVRQQGEAHEKRDRDGARERKAEKGERGEKGGDKHGDKADRAPAR
jgi:hypothetical protein